MRRTPLKRRTPLSPGAPLRRQTSLSRGTSLRRRARGVARDLYEQVLARDGGCIARGLVPQVSCMGRIDPHHRLMRSQGGKDSLDNLISVCRAHHDWIHAHPARSYDLDLLRHPDRSTQRSEEDSCGN